MKLRTVLLVMLCTLFTLACLAGADDSPRNVAGLQKYLMGGLEANRKLLRRWVFHGHGRKLDQNRPWGKLEGEVAVFCAGDSTKGLLRFDREEPIRTIANESNKNWILGKTGGRFIRSPEKCTWWILGAHSATIVNGAERAPSQIKPFDVRAVGVGFWVDFQMGAELDDHLRVFAQPCTRIEHEGKGIYRLEWRLGPNNSIESKMWIDEKQGFAAVRFEGGGIASNPRIDEPRVTWSISWEEKERVWVPKSFHIEQRRSDAIESLDLAIDWVSINQQVPADFFRAEALQLKDGTLLVDRQLGRPLVLGRFHEDGFHAQSPEELASSHKVTWRPWAALALTVAVFCMAGVVFRILRKRRV